MDKLNLNSMLKGLQPVVIGEYKVVNSRVAQIVVSTAERTNSELLRANLSERLGDAVSPIRGSFRWLDADRTSCHGFVARVNPCVMLEGKTPVESGFRMVASNMYLSEADKSTWELKSGAAGQYMVRHGEDDLGELLEASYVGGRGAGTPRMSTIAAATAQPTEFVAFVNSMGTAIPAVDYGFCIGVEGDKFKLVCAGYDNPISVRSNEIVSVHTLDSKEVASLYASGSSKNKIAAAAYDKQGSAAYYKKLYSYAPDYLRLVLKEIDEMAAM